MGFAADVKKGGNGKANALEGEGASGSSKGGKWMCFSMIVG